MIEIRRPSTWFLRALASGEWVAQPYRWDTHAAPAGVLDTSAGPIVLPSGQPAVLYPDLRVRGGVIEICASGQEKVANTDHGYLWDGTTWRDVGPSWGMDALMWGPACCYINRNGLAYETRRDDGDLVPYTPADLGGQGFRYIGADGLPVSGSSTYVDLARQICERSSAGEFAIGIPVDGPGILVRFEDDGVLRLIAGDEAGPSTLHVHRDGDRVAVSWHSRQTLEGVARWYTVAELRALPAVTTPEALPIPVVVPPLPRPVDWGYYKVFTENEPEPDADWRDFDPREWPCTHAVCDTKRGVLRANLIPFPVIANPADARDAVQLVAIRIGLEGSAETHDQKIAAARALSIELDRPLLVYFDGDPRDSAKHPWPTRLQPDRDVVSWPTFAASTTETVNETLARHRAIAAWLVARGCQYLAPASMAFDRTWAWPTYALGNQQVIASRLAYDIPQVIAVSRFSLGRSGWINGRHIGGTAVHAGELRPWHETEIAATPDAPFRWPRPSQFATPQPNPNPPPTPPPAPNPEPTESTEEINMAPKGNEYWNPIRAKLAPAVAKLYGMSEASAHQGIIEAIDAFQRPKAQDGPEVAPTIPEIIDFCRMREAGVSDTDRNALAVITVSLRR